jgi:hypothetical protein
MFDSCLRAGLTVEIHFGKGTLVMEKQALIERLKEIVGPDHVLSSDMDLAIVPWGSGSKMSMGNPPSFL